MTAQDDRSETAGVARTLFAITVAFELVDGRFAEFHRLVSENASSSVRLEAGCMRFDVLTPTDDAAPARIFLYELYSDRAAFDLHLASDHYKAFDLRTRDMVSRKTVWSYSASECAKPQIA